MSASAKNLETGRKATFLLSNFCFSFPLSALLFQRFSFSAFAFSQAQSSPVKPKQA
ncbi:MAG: hypothetical protein ACLQSR_13470 [Limisphaerales bacterium]